MIRAFAKQSSEEYTIGVDFSAVGKLPSGVTISSGTVSAIDTWDGSSASLIVLGSTTATISSGNVAKVRVKGGVSGKVYKITFLLTLSDAGKLEEDLSMTVWEL